MRKRLLALVLTLVMVLTMLPVTAMADENTMTLTEFVAAVESGNGTYDGEGVVVLLEPASGCRLNHSGDHPEVTDGTPDRIQFYDDIAYTQYQRFKTLGDVAISNVTFRLVPPTDEILFCGAWNTTQAKADPDKLDAELQLENTGSVTFTNCVFENVAVSPIGATSSLTVDTCSFSGLGGYAIKDVKAASVSILNSNFDDCSGGVYMNGGGTTSTTYTGNAFTDIGSRGAIQFGGTGDYGNARISITGNRSSGTGAIFRQLNSTITAALLPEEELRKTNAFDENAPMFLPGTSVTANKEIYLNVDTGSDSNTGGSADPVKTFAKAMSLVNAGDTILVTGDLRHSIKDIDKPVTIQGAGESRVSVSGGVQLPEASGTVTFRNLSFDGSSTIGNYDRNSDAYANLDLVIEDCAFTQAGGNCVYIAPKINSLTVKNCDFTAPQGQTEYGKQYFIWPYQAKTITITGNTFDGRDVTRAPIHLGDGHPDGTTAVISGNTIRNFERGVQLAFINTDNNLVTIDGNIFENIALSSNGTLSKDYEVATVFVYETLDKNGGKTTVNYTNNALTGSSKRIAYSESSTATASELFGTFTGNTIGGVDAGTIEDNWYDAFVAQVGDVKYTSLADAISSAASGSTITVLTDVQLADDTSFAINKQLHFVGADLGGKKPAITVHYTGTQGSKGLFAFQSGSAGSSIENLQINITGAGAKRAYAVLFANYQDTDPQTVIRNVDFVGDADINNIGTQIGISSSNGTTGGNVLVTGCTFTNFCYGVYADNISNFVFDSNKIDGTKYNAINLGEDGGSNSQIPNKIFTNISHANFDDPVYSSGITVGANVSDVTITGNSISMLNGKLPIYVVEHTTTPQVTVTFRDGNAVFGMYLVPAGTHKLPAAPTKDGYIFLGWSDGKTTYQAEAAVLISADTIFNAQWSAISTGTTAYSVSVASAANGKVTTSTARATKGSTVTITVTPDKGYALDQLTVTDANGNAVSVTKVNDTKYTFTMPASSVTVRATFVDESLPFTDVSGHWALEAIEYVYKNGMMNGTTATKFGPEAKLTRGMIVTILYRLEGEPAVSGNTFDDVNPSQYYADPIAWAAKSGIVTGYDETTFGPENSITREQLAAILYRYATYKGYDVSKAADLSVYTDADSVSAYAKDAMAWANAEGLITGVTTTTLNPTGTATRAQVATMLMRFCENIAE